MNLYVYPAIALGWFLSLAGCYAYADQHGKLTERATCANQAALASGHAVEAWEAASRRQSALDADQRALDIAAAKDAQAAAQAVADRFAKLKIAVVNMPPASNCKVSPEWVARWNEAQ